MKELFTRSGPGQDQSDGYRVPCSTYRLQLNSEFTFADATAIAEYLHDLGITDCYASPILAARPGSTHGYDVCDCAKINPEAGSREEFDRWTKRLQGLGMGLLLDIVPNHMSTDLSNTRWRDVLRHGQDSEFAHWFDIDWHPPDKRLHGKVLLPILEAPYWKVLEAGKLQVIYGQEGFALTYHSEELPLSPDSCEYLQQEILNLCRAEAKATESFEDLTTLGEVAAKLNSWGTISDAGRARQTSLNIASRQGTRPEIWPALQRALKRFNGSVGTPESFDSLHALLQRQHYRLAHWRLGNEEINYRRFFDVTDLVALRVEEPEVFQAAHELVLHLVQQGKVTGLRVDHPDGLWNPQQYFDRLQQAALRRERGATSSSLYVVAEKILNGQEALASDWPVAGTTGYDFLNQLNGIFINCSSREALDQLYFEFTGAENDFRSLVYGSKLMILQNSLRSDLRSLSALLRFIAARTRYGLDFGGSEIQDALAAIAAAFPVYRTYMTEQSQVPSQTDRAVIKKAIESAKQANQPLDREVLSFIESLLLLSPPKDLDEEGLTACRQFVMKFQQLTAPVMAKGLEDTAFYNYNRLISLNEVGGSPDQFGFSLHSFHEQNRLRTEHWPHSLLATATHDTKRGEDLRARLNVLSEIPEEWRQAVMKWSRLNAEKKTEVDGEQAPDANDEYFLYQTLVGAWVNEAEATQGSDGFRQRICQYMLKAIREAKSHTCWTEPNQTYEEATERFIQQILTHSQTNLFLDDFMLFYRKIAFFGLFNSLAQVVLKMTCPGVPDFYQGTELWDFSLVDPDNRCPVDYQTRKALFADLREKLESGGVDVAGLVKLLFKNYQSGQIKLYLIWRLLQIRRQRRVLFERGDYLPLTAIGAKKDHLCSFARRYSGESVITVAARLVLGLSQGSQRGALEADVWQDTALPVLGGRPGEAYKDALTQQVVAVRPDGSLPIPEVLALLPVAVLERVA